MHRRTDIVGDGTLTPEEQRELVQRVSQGHVFASSATLRAFLLYVADHAINGRLDEIKEQQIGSHVLGRKSDYDPAADNIVRVRARQLRQKLEEHFEDEGKSEPVVVSIPKGAYVPVFRPRLHTDQAALPPSKPVPGPKTRVPAAALWLIVTLLAAVIAIQLWSTRNTRLTQATETPTDATRNLWSQFFPAKNQEITVVTADSGFALWQDVTHRTLSLGDYVSRKYQRNQSDNPEIREIAARRNTSASDVTLSLRLAEIARAYGGRIKLQFARNLDIHDLRSGNVVLLGSRRSNPWVEVFEPHLNFVLDHDKDLRGPCFRNKKPKPGERSTFAIAGTSTINGVEDRAMESYAVAALLPGTSGNGKVLLIQGLNMEGTEAAGEFITNPEKFKAVLRRIGIKKDTPVTSFEVLLKLTAVAGGYANTELVAYRYPAE